MPVFLDVESRLNQGALNATAREIRSVFDALGRDISGGLGRHLSQAFSGFDTSAARRELLSLQNEYRRLNDVQLEAARIAQRSAAEVEVANRRMAESIAKYGDASSQAARAQMLHADAQARAARDARIAADATDAATAAHSKLGKAAEDSAGAAAMASRVWNGVGVASLGAFSAAFVETTKKAGDFQQSQQRLVSSAGETAANLKVVSDGILQLAGQVGYSAQELSTGMYTVEKAGYRGADGVNVLRSAAQLAKAENADLGEVLNGLTTSMHDFGYGTDRAAEVASKMNTAVGEAKTNLQEFSGALHSVEPIAAAAGLKLEDVYGSLAQITQSGTSADQGAQNMARSISQLLKPSQQMRDEMAAMGVDARDVQAHLGERGFAGTVQMLSNAIRQHMNPAQQVVIDTMFKSQQATDAANQMFNNLPPAAHRVAQAIQEGSLSFKEFRKSRGGLSVEDANLVNQWANLNNKVAGFSNVLKSGQGDIQTYEQALALMTGGQESLRTVLQLVGDNAEATNDKIKAVKDTTAETDGTVKGFNETQQTLNAKMADAKAAFGAAAIEVGNAFIPVMTDVANVAKTVGDEMAKHPGITHAVIDALGLLGGAWLGFKALNIAETILMPVARGLGNIIAGEEGAAAAAGRLSTSLSLVGTAAAGLAAAQAADSLVDQNPALRDVNHAGGGPNQMVQNFADHFGADRSRAFFHRLFTGHAAGGAIHGPGPNGIDSVPAWLAPGEHVLTHLDVAKMGGHSGVYKFRQALHRQYGGAVGPDVMAAEQMVGTPYSQGARNDCSGMVGRVVNAALGIPGGGLPTTKNMGTWLAQRGFVPGIGGPGTISVGWYDHGPNPNDGHTAMTLSDGENAESGGSHGNFLIGGGAAGASSAQFDHHMYLPNIYGEGPAVGGGGGGRMGGMGGFGGGAGGGGGIPAGATAGTGPGGIAGYYTPNPQRVASATERLRHLDAEIATAEKRKSELKADASQSTRDRLDEEIRHLKEERRQEEGRLAEAQRGTFHAGRGGRGGGMGMGGPNLPVPLPERFGLGKGLPGLAEWTVGFLEDLVLGPMETGISAAMQQAGLPAPGSTGTGLIGIISNLAQGGGGGGALGPLTGGPLGGSADLGAGGGPGMSGPSDAGAAAGSDVGGSHGGGMPKIAAPSSGGGGGLLGFVSSPHGVGGSIPRPGAPGAPPNTPPPPSSADYKDWYSNQDFYKGWYPTPLGPVPAQSPNAYGPPSSGSDWRWGPAHVTPPAPSGPMRSPLQQQQSMLGGAGSGESGPLKPLPSGPFLGGDPRWNPAMHFSTGGPIGYFDQGGLDQIIPPTPGGMHDHMPGIGPSGGSDPGISSGGPDIRGPGGVFHREGDDIIGYPWGVAQQAGYGPRGTDTVPAWLTPGEYVENKSAVDRYGAAFMDALNQGRVDPSSVRYYDEGSPGGVAPPPSAPKTATPAPKPANQSNQAVKPGPNQPPGPPGPQQPGTPGQKPGDQPGPDQGAPGPKPLDIAAKGADALPGGDPKDAKTRPGLNQPGSSQETFGQELPASSGIGFGGGLLGAAEGAASQAAGMAASAGTFGAAGGAASSAMDMAFQLINRTAAYGAQAAGIGVEGVLETLLPADSPLSNFANTLPGKVLAGVAGVRPAAPNTAGQTQAPLTGSQEDKAETSMAGTQIGMQVQGDMHVHSNNADEFHQDLQRTYQGAQASYPMRTP